MAPEWIHLFISGNCKLYEWIKSILHTFIYELQSDPGPGDSGINRDRAALGASNWKEQTAFQGRTYGMVISHNHPISCNFAFGTQRLDPYPGFNASE